MAAKSERLRQTLEGLIALQTRLHSTLGGLGQEGFGKKEGAPKTQPKPRPLQQHADDPAPRDQAIKAEQGHGQKTRKAKKNLAHTFEEGEIGTVEVCNQGLPKTLQKIQRQAAEAMPPAIAQQLLPQGTNGQRRT